MRLIDSDELDKVKYYPLPYIHITPSDVDAESYMRGWNDAIDAIMSDAPTIEERKTGKWINNIHDIPICDQCGYMTPYDRAIDDYEYGNYCPNCGADMREQP